MRIPAISSTTFNFQSPFQLSKHAEMSCVAVFQIITKAAETAETAKTAERKIYWLIGFVTTIGALFRKINGS
jgi:hypothetical protein